MYIHSNDLESLHNHVPQEILPESLGGLISDDEAFDTDIEERILSREEYYQEFTERINQIKELH